MAGNLTAMIASIFSGGVTPDPYYEYTTLLLPGNGTNGAQNNTFLDGSTNNFTITRNGNTTQGTFSPFSQTGWGGYFTGSGANLTLSSSAVFGFGTGDFTIEYWIYPSLTGDANQVVIDSRTSDSAIPWVIGQTTGGAVRYYDGATVRTGGTMTANTWNHVAWCRASNVNTIYLNGSSVSTYTATQDFGSSKSLTIGSNVNTAVERTSGYISNLRITKGRAVYTGAFTPPTTPLTRTTGGTNPPQGTECSLLTCQSNRFLDSNGVNVPASSPLTITATGSPTVVAFSPFNPTASWSAATYGGSGYFDGSGDYLSVSDNAAFDFGSGAFTVEAWFYRTGGGDRISQTVYSQSVLASASNSALFFGAGNNGVSLYLSTSGSSWTNSIETGVAPTLNAWSHVVWQRNGNTLEIYLNGSLQTVVSGTAAFSGTIFNSSRDVEVGIQGSTNGPLFGYLCNLRVVKGATVYTGNFTPPTAPITNAGSTSAASYPSTTNVNTSFASSATSLLLNFTNAGIYDATSKNDLETVGNAQISTTQSKFGGSSISFDGTGDWLLIPDQPPQRIGTGNFTVEMWVYRNSSGTYGLAGKGTGTTGWLVSLNSSNQVVFTYGSSTITSSGTVSATTWTHIAVVREGTSTNQTKIYIGGSNDGTGTVNTDFNQTNSMYIGADRTGGSAANAYVQDVRITNYARYTGNFTPPTAAFPTL